MASTAPFIAHPLRRLVAGVLDLFLSFLIYALGYQMHSAHSPTAAITTALFVYGFYHAMCFSAFNGLTVGLRAMNIRLISATRQSDITIPKAILRAAFRPALLFLFGWLAIAYASSGAVRFAVIASPIAIELAMMLTLVSRQTLSDVVSNTLVINVPPLQPHRAPAGPMYSATDAEFGIRPRK